MALSFPTIDEKEEVSVFTDTPWQVIVSNDPVNLFQVVQRVFQRVLGVDPETALRYTKVVHYEGRCAVFSGSQEECQEKAAQLMAFQLWTHVEKVTS